MTGVLLSFILLSCGVAHEEILPQVDTTGFETIQYDPAAYGIRSLYVPAFTFAIPKSTDPQRIWLGCMDDRASCHLDLLTSDGDRIEIIVCRLNGPAIVPTWQTDLAVIRRDEKADRATRYFEYGHWFGRYESHSKYDPFGTFSVSVYNEAGSVHVFVHKIRSDKQMQQAKKLVAGVLNTVQEVKRKP